MIRILTIGLILLSLAAFARAAELGPKLKEGEILRGNFVQERHLAGFVTPLKSDGVFILAPEHGLIWSAERPFVIRTVITPAGLVQDANGKRTLRIDAAQVPAMEKLFSLLGATLSEDWHELERDFVVAREGDDAHWQVKLVFRREGDVAMPFREITVTGGRFVDEVTLTRAANDFDRLIFSVQSVMPGPLTADEGDIFAAAAR
jgi:outer membrane lipoprotein carrier protein LolA